MPADYKSRANPRPRQKHQQSPCWLWFTLGVILGSFTAGLAWLKLGQGALDRDTASRSTAADSSPRRETDALQRPPKPRFDFYTILPEMEVIIPDEEIEPPATANRVPDKNPPTSGQPAEAYLVQVGSFRNHADADRMKARLALLGLEADIQRVTINNKDTFHRVRSGPFASREEVNRVRSRLSQNQISSIAIKLKP